MMNYCVVEGNYLYELTEEVKTKIQYGWKPQGGIIVVPVGNRNRYLQAMIKE